VRRRFLERDDVRVAFVDVHVGVGNDLLVLHGEGGRGREGERRHEGQPGDEALLHRLSS
jgi:hypothetical protein